MYKPVPQTSTGNEGEDSDNELHGSTSLNMENKSPSLENGNGSKCTWYIMF